MPNHIHLLVYVPSNGDLINKTIASGKRFLAYEMIKRLKRNNEEGILKILANAVNALEKRRGKKHRVFTISSDLKECFSERFIIQKLNYIHNNPVSKKWRLSADISSYVYSSACYYELGEVGLYPVFDYRYKY